MRVETGDVNLARAVAIELTQLRRNEGLTRVKLAQCKTLLDLPCVTRELQHNATTEARAIKAMRLIASLLAQDRNLRYLAVRNAFGLDANDDPGTLTRRRSQFSKEHDVSVDAVRDWERDGIHELSLHLIELGMRDEGVARSGTRPLTHAPPLAVAGDEDYELFICSVDLMYRYENGRQPSTRLEIRTVEALIDGVQGYVYQLLYSGDPAHVSAESIDGCKVHTSKAPWGEEIIVRVEFDRALVRGERYRFIYRLNIRPGPREPQPWVFTTVLRPTQLVTLRVQFSPDLVPGTVSTFSSLVRTDPTFMQTLDELSPLQGHVEARFPVPRLGITYGLHWEWPENL